MLKAFFKNFKNGRMGRRSFLGYSLLLALLLFVCTLISFFAMVFAREIGGGVCIGAQSKLRCWLTLIFVFVYLVGLVLIVLAEINIHAKRCRDIGLPGWWAVLTFTGLEVILSKTISTEAGSGLYILIFILLIFIPSNAVAKKSCVG